MTRAIEILCCYGAATLPRGDFSGPPKQKPRSLMGRRASTCNLAPPKGLEPLSLD